MAVSEERRKWIQGFAVGEDLVDLDDDRLMAWSDEDEDRRVDAFLATVTDPEELHIYVDEYDWDGGLLGLKKALEHPLCDLGTVRLAYWRAKPTFYLRYRDREAAVEARQSEVYDLLRWIEDRVQRGLHAKAELPYDPANDYGNDLRPKAQEILRSEGRDVPAFMYQAIPSKA